MIVLRITELAIKRPAAMTMIIMFFVVLGLAGYSRLNSDLFPETNIPYITVVTYYPGAGAGEIEEQVLEPLEDAVAPVSGLKRNIATASEGLALMVLEFSMSTDADEAISDVQRAVNEAANLLPEGVESPVVRKYNFNDQPIMTLVLSGNRSLDALHGLAEDVVKQHLEALPGVGRVEVTGGRQREVQVLLDRNRLENYGLSINYIADRIAMENVNLPAGSLHLAQDTDFTIRLLGKYDGIRELAELEIPFRGGTVKLADLGTVTEGYADVTSKFHLNGREAVGITIQKQSDAGTVETAARVERELDAIRSQLPGDTRLVLAQNSATFIRDSLNETKRTLVEGVLMCGLVLAFFLRRWRSVITVMLAIPTSIVSTFLMMYLAGFTFNLLSLMGLTLCVGILVDDSIVVLENIHRHRTMGKDPVTAAIDGRKEIGLAAVAITAQDVVVFLPIAFLSGIVGQFFRQFGLTVVCAALFSLFVSFTLTPMLAAHLERHELPFARPPVEKRRRPNLARRLDLLFNRALGIYRAALLWSLNHRRLVLGGLALALLATASLIPLRLIGSEFLTTPDQNRFTVEVELPSGSSLQHTENMLVALENRLLELPEVELCYSRVGGGRSIFGGTGTHLGEIDVILVDKTRRERTVWDICEEVRSWKRDYPGVKLVVTEEPVVGVGDQGAPVQLEVTGPDREQLAALAGQIESVVRSTPGAVDVRSTWKPAGEPEVQVRIDRERAASFGLAAGEIARTLRAAVTGETAGTMESGGEDLDIRVRLDQADLDNVDAVKQITVCNTLGESHPVHSMASVELASGPTVINHQNKQRLITISANIKDRPLGDVTADIDSRLAGLHIPEGYHVEYFGSRQDMDEAFRDLIMVLFLSVTLVYMILVILYESFLTPVLRLLSLPCGMIGALWALFVTGHTFNMMSLIGLVMLDGLAAKSGTLLIDYTNTLRKRGLPLREALVEAGTTRLRPIIMTALTMIAGVTPTALALAAGSELRQSMAVVLIGGLVTSTILTPLVVPVAYSILDDIGKRTKKRKNMYKSSEKGA